MMSANVIFTKHYFFYFVVDPPWFPFFCFLDFVLLKNIHTIKASKNHTDVGADQNVDLKRCFDALQAFPRGRAIIANARVHFDKAIRFIGI